MTSFAKRLTVKHLHTPLPADVALTPSDKAGNRMTSEMMYPPFVLQLPHARVDPAGMSELICVAFAIEEKQRDSDSREPGPSFPPCRQSLFVLVISFRPGHNLLPLLVILVLQTPVDKPGINEVLNTSNGATHLHIPFPRILSKCG
jgi:hypothetical protein